MAMSMEKRFDFDQTDRQIAALLRKDGRSTAAHLAREVGVSEGAIRKRIKKLTSREILRIVGIVDPGKLGYSIHVLMGVQVSPQHITAVADQLASLDQVRYVALFAGSLDIIFAALFRDQDELHTFKTKDLSAIPGIIRVEMWQNLKVMKRTYDWFGVDHSP